MPDPELGERIHDRVDHGRRRADTAGFAAALDAEGIGATRTPLPFDRDIRNIRGARQRIVHQAARKGLAAVALVPGVLAEGLPHALHHASVDLTGEE